ncbi:MAG: response regulator [Chitinophagales bacterium]|nr:response regulator [Chitinophagales bacterium]
MADDDLDDAAFVMEALDVVDPHIGLKHVPDGQYLIDMLHGLGNLHTERHAPLILLDLNMPRKGGLETLREIRSNPFLNILPVLILSTSASQRDIQEAYINGANCYVIKPFTFNDWIYLMKGLTRFWLRKVIGTL